MASKANKRGEIRRRRRHYAERRAATTKVREAVNERMRAQGHPGWTPPRPPWGDDFTSYLEQY